LRQALLARCVVFPDLCRKERKEMQANLISEPRSLS
jgi:hypothetical protein